MPWKPVAQGVAHAAPWKPSGQGVRQSAPIYPSLQLEQILLAVQLMELAQLEQVNWQLLPPKPTAQVAHRLFAVQADAQFDPQENWQLDPPYAGWQEAQAPLAVQGVKQ